MLSTPTLPLIQFNVPCFYKVGLPDFLSSKENNYSFENFEKVTNGDILSYVKSLLRSKAVFDTITLFILKSATPHT